MDVFFILDCKEPAVDTVENIGLQFVHQLEGSTVPLLQTIG